MTEKPTYEELEQRVKELEKEVLYGVSRDIQKMKRMEEELKHRVDLEKLVMARSCPGIRQWSTSVPML